MATGSVTDVCRRFNVDVDDGERFSERLVPKFVSKWKKKTESRHDQRAEGRRTGENSKLLSQSELEYQTLDPALVA